LINFRFIRDVICLYNLDLLLLVYKLLLSVLFGGLEE